MSLVPQMVLARHFRRGSGLRLRPINSVKEIVDSTLLGIVAGVKTTVVLGTALNDYIGGVGTFPVGSKVSSVYIFAQFIQDGTGVSNVDWYFFKLPGAIPTATPGATGGDVFRKFILHEEKGIPGNNSDGAAPLSFRGVIKIPRGRQRMAEGDVFGLIGISAVTAGSWCIKAIYKAYR